MLSDTMASFTCLIISVSVLVVLVVLILCDRKDLSWNETFSNVGGVGDGFCFDGSMKILVKTRGMFDLENEKEILADDIEEHNVVGIRTVDFLGTNSSANTFIWTKVGNMDVFWGNWKTHRLSFKTGEHFKIRSPYLMMIFKDGSWCGLRSEKIKARDEMIYGTMISRVTVIHHYNKSDPIEIQREDCTMHLNDVFAYRYCDYSQETSRMVFMANVALKKHKSAKYWSRYDNASTNLLPWKSSYKLY